MHKIKKIKRFQKGVMRCIPHKIPQIGDIEMGSAIYGAGAKIAEKSHLGMETSKNERVRGSHIIMLSKNNIGL